MRNLKLLIVIVLTFYGQPVFSSIEEASGLQDEAEIVVDEVMEEKETLTHQEYIDFFDRLPKINKPVLIITGRFDDIASPEEAHKADELIKNSKVVVLPNAGHESFLDQPELFNEAILNYIKTK